ncbi:MAG: toll/interleukin-1 receptor domain-containing protein [Burkholderiales bacterium]
MTSIFLSYRRSDTGGYAGRLTDALEKHFGKNSVFQDIEAITPGSNFEKAIDTAVAHCDVLLVLIGDTWSTERSEQGHLRLEDPHDFLRLEVASALRAKKRVLPVLVEGARMPASGALPADLRALTGLQALELSDNRWDYDVERLVAAIRTLTGTEAPSELRRALIVAGGAIVLGGVVAAAYKARNRPPDVSGRWNLPNGSFWIVMQDGNRLTIEETHYQSKEVWKRGNGTVSREGVEFVLDLIYGGPRQWTGSMKLSEDKNTMSGVVRDVVSGTKSSLTLTRVR